jgi:Tfp pilus assembly protein PilF
MGNYGYSNKDLTVSKNPQPYTKENLYKAIVVPLFAEVFFKSAIKAKPTDMINYLLLSETYMRNGKHSEARRVLLAAQKLAPNCSYLYDRLIEVYSRENNETDANIAIEWLKDNDPTNPYSLKLMIQDEIKKENYKAAEAKVAELEKLYGVNEYTTLRRIDIAAKTSNQSDVIKMCDAAYEKYPNYYAFVELKHIIEISVNNNTSAAINVWKKYLNYYHSNNIMTKVAEDYFKKGDTQKALQIYIDLTKRSPGTVGYMQTIAAQYFQQQDYKNAELWYKNAIACAPYIGDYWGGLAKIYNSESRKSDAIEAYHKALSFTPTDYKSRRELRTLENKKDVFDYFEQPNIYKLCKSAPDASAFPEDNSLYLIDETQKVVYSGGASEEKHIFAVKVFDAKGVDRWKQYSIYYTGSQRLLIEDAEVVKANGSKVKAETKDYKVVFTSLEPGDTIYVSYKIESYNSGKLAQHFWDNSYFTHYFPYLKTKYSLLIAPDIKFKYKMSKEDLKPVITKADEFDLYVWEKNDQPSIKSEDHMPPISDLAQILFVSSLPDWTYVSNWYSDLATKKEKSDF